MIRVYRLAHELALAKNPQPFQPAPSENRWNSVDTQVAYGGEHLALSALKLLTYWGHYPDMRGYQLFTLDIRSEDVEDVLDQSSNIDPNDYSQTRRYGDSWVEEGRSLALKVPSVVIPMSYNYLINPQHSIFDPEEVTFRGAFEYEARIARLIEEAKADRPSS